MAETTSTLHQLADTSAGKGDFQGALSAATQILAVQPSDHRARLKLGLAFALVGNVEAGLKILRQTAELMLGEGYVLQAIGACRDAFALSPDDDETKTLLGRVHDALHQRPVPRRLRVLPPAPPAPADPELLAELRGLSETDLQRRAVTLAASGGSDATPEVDGVPLLSEVSKEAFVSLVQTLEQDKRPAGHAVFEQGASGTRLFLLLQGEVEVRRETDGETKVLARLPAGSLFGELALLTDKPRSATVVTTQPSELIALSRAQVEGLTQAHPELSGQMVSFARRRLLMNLLSTAEVFAPFDHATRLQILQRFSSRVVAESETIISEDAPSEGLFMVLEGQVEVTKIDEAGDKLVLAYLTEGQVFGEISLLREQPATAHVAAAEKSVVLFLSRADFSAFVKDHPEVQDYLTKLSETRVQEIEEAMADDGLVLDADDLIIL